MSDKQEHYNNFVENSTYYNSILHNKKCKICKLPTKIKQYINKMILSGEELQIIARYLNEQFPDYFKDDENTNKVIRRHKKYLPQLLDDVFVKNIFARAKHILENKDIDNLDEIEKAKLINEVELEVMKEYQDIEHERFSMLHVMFNETIPLLLTRLHDEILSGKARDVKDLTDASQVILKMTAMLSVKEEGIEKNTTEELRDYDLNSDTKSNILSLADKIKFATKAK